MADGDPVDGAVAEEIRELVLRLARQNARWGYQRIVGELAGVGVGVSTTTVAKILRQAGVSPAGARAQLSWRDFLRPTPTRSSPVTFSRSRRSGSDASMCSSSSSSAAGVLHLAGCTANPDGGWIAQQARQLAWSFSERATPARFLVHDRDSKFSRAFDEVFRSEGVRDHPHPVSGAQGKRVRRTLGGPGSPIQDHEAADVDELTVRS